MRRQILDIINATIGLISIKRRGVASHVRREINRKVYEKQTARVEKELTDALTKHFNAAVQSAVSKLKSKAGSLSNASSDKIIKAIYDSDEWYDDLVDKCLPVLAKGMSESAAGFFLSLGIDPRRSKQVGIKSTATDWLESTGEELPPGIATDLPEWMQDEISEQLRESFEQPYWQDIDKTTAGDIRTYLDHGVNNGWSIERIATEITEAFPDEYGKRRARVVARTEAGHALNGARNAAYTRMKEQLPPEVAKSINKSWLSVLGNTTRDDHANLDGEMADEDGNFNLGGVDVPWPGHFSLPPAQRINCLPGFVKVSGTFDRAMRSWYDGTVVEIVTGSGGRLTVTPNHPVMTKHGFIPAGMLKPCDEVLLYDRRFELSSTGKDVDDEPVFINQIFDTFKLWSSALSTSIEIRRAHAVDFHGDGESINGDVEIVRPNWELLFDDDSVFFDKGGDFVFPCVRDGSSVFEFGACSSGFAFNGVCIPPSSIPRCGQGLLDVFWGFVIAPSGDLAIRVASDCDATLFESSKQGGSTVSRFLRNALQGNSRLIFVDEIIEISNIKFSGHVYDLQSPYGWMAASDDNVNVQYIVSNCQCSITSEFGADAPLQEIEDALADQPEEVEEPAQPVAEEPEPVPVPIADDDEPELSLPEKLEQNKELNSILEAVLGSNDSLAEIAEFEVEKARLDALLKAENKVYFDLLAKYKTPDERSSLEFVRARSQYKDRFSAVSNLISANETKIKTVRDRMTVDARQALQLTPNSRMAFNTHFRKHDYEVARQGTVEPSKVYKEKFSEATDFLSSVVKVRESSDGASEDRTSMYVGAYQLEKGGRAFCIDNRGSNEGVYVTELHNVKTYVHELGHHLENTLSARNAANEFLDYRIDQAGTRNVSMAEATGIKAYGPHEIGNEDSFNRAFEKDGAFYVGKRYSDGSTEILSMGLEKLYEDPIGFAQKDPEFFKFVVGVMRGVL